MPNALTETSRRPLWREREVHRDAFIDPEVFALEMQTVFTHTWVYVGHASQIPQAGDYATTTVGDQPVVMVRQWDGGISVLHNRCAHKGVKVAGQSLRTCRQRSGAGWWLRPIRPCSTLTALRRNM